MTLPLKKYRKGSIGTEPGSDPASSPPDPSAHQPSTDKILPSFSQGELLPPPPLLLVASDEMRRDEGEEGAEQNGAAAEGAHTTLLEGEPSS